MDFATLCGMDKVNFREVLLKSASSKGKKIYKKQSKSGNLFRGY